MKTRIALTFFLSLLTYIAPLYAQWNVLPEAYFTVVKRNDFGDSWNIATKVGVSLTYQSVSPWGMKSGLYYAFRGYDLGKDFGETEYPPQHNIPNAENKITRHFLQIPLEATYAIDLRSNRQLQFGAGPYIGVSLKDKWKGGYYFGTKESVFSDLQPFDWGVSAFSTLKLNKWDITLGYDLSLGKETKGTHVSANYHSISLGIGYRFSLTK